MYTVTTKTSRYSLLENDGPNSRAGKTTGPEKSRDAAMAFCLILS